MGMVSQEKWDKTKGLLKELIEMLTKGPGCVHRGVGLEMGLGLPSEKVDYTISFEWHSQPLLQELPRIRIQNISMTYLQDLSSDFVHYLFRGLMYVGN